MFDDLNWLVEALHDIDNSTNDDEVGSARAVLRTHSEPIARMLVEVLHTQDPVVQEVVNKLVSRSKQGMKTYGVTMEGNPLSAKEWINHAVEEALDLANYLTRLKREV